MKHKNEQEETFSFEDSEREKIMQIYMQRYEPQNGISQKPAHSAEALWRAMVQLVEKQDATIRTKDAIITHLKAQIKSLDNLITHQSNIIDELIKK